MTVILIDALIDVKKERDWGVGGWRKKGTVGNRIE